MYLIFKTFRTVCRAAPLHYTGTTIDGKFVDIYSRHGSLRVTVDDHIVFSHYMTSQDEVYNLSSVTSLLAKHGLFLHVDNAEHSSVIEDGEAAIEAAIAASVQLEFRFDFTSESTGLSFKIGDVIRVNLKDTPRLIQLIDSGQLVLAYPHEKEKLANYLAGERRNEQEDRNNDK